MFSNYSHKFRRNPISVIEILGILIGLQSIGVFSWILNNLKISTKYGFPCLIEHSTLLQSVTFIFVILLVIAAIALIRFYTEPGTEDRNVAKLTAMFLISPFIFAWGFFVIFRVSMPLFDFVASILLCSGLIWLSQKMLVAGVGLVKSF